jgi:serine/threonine protein kinase
VAALKRPQVVVKTYRRRPNDDKSYKVKIMREAETLGIFKHPHITQLRYFTRIPDAWLLYFEHAGWTTLTQYLIQHGNYSHSGPMGAKSWGAWDTSNDHTARRFARQIGSALRYCHMNCVHHCNLHSDKIIITDKGNVKVTGFGSLQFRSAVDDDSFDTFSYGTILWHMICGNVPWPVQDNYTKFASRDTSTLVTDFGAITPGTPSHTINSRTTCEELLTTI